MKPDCPVLSDPMADDLTVCCCMSWSSITKAAPLLCASGEWAQIVKGHVCMPLAYPACIKSDKVLAGIYQERIGMRSKLNQRFKAFCHWWQLLRSKLLFCVPNAPLSLLGLMPVKYVM